MRPRPCAQLVLGLLIAFAVPARAGFPDQASQTNDLGGVERYATFVSTDKAIYRVGDTVMGRAVVLETRRHHPWTQPLNAMVILKGPRGDIVHQGWARGEAGAVGFGWTVPEGQSGGTYTYAVSFPNQGIGSAERSFDVRSYRPPRLNSQITFERDGYGPGAIVVATVHTERAEGGIPQGAKVEVSARVDDADVFHGTTVIDAQGNAITRFALPGRIAEGDGTVAMTIEDGGVVETATKTLPIVLQSLDLAMYPEGGDLVAGLSTRVYLEARTPAKKPADIRADIIDDQNNNVATCVTEHEGRGRCVLTPLSDRAYHLVIREPVGISRTFPLPPVKAAGATLSANDDIIRAGAPARLTVAATRSGQGVLTVRRHEIEVGRRNIGLGPTPKQVSIELPADVDGVLSATLWDGNGTPLAERLIFRAPPEGLRIAVQATRKTYEPGGSVDLDITTTRANGQPVAATVGITVTDDSISEMQETRDQAPRLPVMVLLEPEVRELADAQVYLDPNQPRASLATDLLLGTQGWRRFALSNVPQFLAREGDRGRRALAWVEPPPPPMPAPSAVPEMDGIAPDPPAMARQAPVPAGAAPPHRMLLGGVAAQRFVGGLAPAAAPPMPPARPAVAGGVALRNRAMGRAMPAPRAAIVARSGIIYVREYAHRLPTPRPVHARDDFSETLYFHAGLRTDTQGKARIHFDLSDAVTTYQAAVDGYSDAGALASTTLRLRSAQPFYVEPKLPLSITEGDVVGLPIALVNNTAYALNDSRLEVTLPTGLRADGVAAPVAVPSGGRARHMVQLDTRGFVGQGNVVIAAQGGNYQDRVSRPFVVQPRGFPRMQSQGGMIAADSTATLHITIPDDAMADSMTTELLVYPSPVAHLQQALARLLREPNGCFEQTSSTSYPLTMAQQYFTTHAGIEPAMVRRGSELLTRSYQRLVGFECQNEGYEWFGGAAPGHEALTAYGLMQFADMQSAGLASLDRAMVNRTANWLFNRRDHRGGFERNARALDSFGGAPELTTNAYIVWALVNAHHRGLQQEIATLKERATASQDSYVQALAAHVAYLTGDVAMGKKLAGYLQSHQDPQSGFVDGAVTSITRSGGEALRIETTALATLAWLQDPNFRAAAEAAMRYLASVCEGGRFGSTQATVLALKAIVADDAAHSHRRAGGSLEVRVDGHAVAAPVAFSKQQDAPIELPSVVARLSPGPHTVQMHMHGGNAMAYSLAVHYHAATAATGHTGKLTLQTRLGSATVREGETTEIHVQAQNSSSSDAAMSVAIVGIPGGLEPRHDQLKELVKAGRIAAYEVRERDVVLYWRQLKAGEVVQVPVSVVAAVPGRYTSAASRAYEYYTDENKYWTSGLAVNIVAL